MLAGGARPINEGDGDSFRDHLHESIKSGLVICRGPRIMRKNPVKAALKAGQPQVGTWLSLGSLFASRVMARVGFPWLTVDMEHSPIDWSEAAALFGAISDAGCVPLCRVPRGICAERSFDWAGASRSGHVLLQREPKAKTQVLEREAHGVWLLEVDVEALLEII